MEEKEVLALIEKALENHKLDVEIMVDNAIKALPETKKGLSESKVSQMITEAVNGATPKIRVTPNPDWNTDKENPKYATLDKVKLKPTEGNPYHKEEWIVEGHQANHFIRKGLATFMEVTEKWVKPKQTGKVIGKA